MRLPAAALSAAVALAAAAAAGAGHARLPGTACGTIVVHAYGDGSYSYAVQIAQGPVPCATARRVLAAFGRTDQAPRGWVCFRGHASQHQRWAAACSPTSAGLRGAIVRAYLLRKVG